MQEFIIVTGIVLKQTPIGEYDRRICLLTKERGKVSAFARGARKPGNRLTAATNSLVFGVFKLREGRDSYTVVEADVQNYFEALMTDYIGACYGMYFAEVADYYGRENNDESDLLKLLYQSLRALTAPALPNPLVKCVYELKAIAVNGEFPGLPTDKLLDPSTAYAINYIVESSIEKLYTFTVTETVLEEMTEIADKYRQTFMDRRFKSLEILKTLC